MLSYCNEWDAFLNVVVGHCWTRNSAMLTGRILLLFLSTTNFMRTTDARSILSPFLARSNHVKPHVGLVFLHIWLVSWKIHDLGGSYFICGQWRWWSWISISCFVQSPLLPGYVMLSPHVCEQSLEFLSVQALDWWLKPPFFWSKIGYDNLGICCIKKTSLAGYIPSTLQLTSPRRSASCRQRPASDGWIETASLCYIPT